MKIKHIIPMLLGILTMFTACSDDNTPTTLDELKVSSSYIALPIEGGSQKITVNATADWAIEKIVVKKDSVKWLNISAATGTAGETELTFSADATLDGRTAEVLIHCAGKTQRLNIIQGLSTVSTATVAEVIAGSEGKNYLVTGEVTNIENTTYGNWWIQDKTGKLYIYGTLDAKGGTKNFASLKLEEGDEVTVSGPMQLYKGSPQLVNVTVVSIKKSLIKVDSVHNATLPVEGGEFTAYVTCKGQGVSVEIPEDAKSWLSISSIKTQETSSIITFKAATNEGGDRTTSVTFTTTDGSKTYSAKTTLTQIGAIVTTTVKNFIDAAVGTTQYRLTGIITRVANEQYGNFYIKDFSGEVYIYGLADFKAKGYKVGDIVTLIGNRGDYKGTPQMLKAQSEKLIPVESATIAEVLAKPDDKNVYYMVTGEITEIANDTYGNLYLKDGDNTIYLYGCYPGYGATGDDRKNVITNQGIKVGDKLTVIAPKTTYNGVVQLSNGYYVSHQSAQ